MLIENCALVLEGGGMRGAFTAGIIDYFLSNNIYFNYTIGVSAGANNGANYTSRQRLRNKKIFTELVTDERYMGFKNLIKDGNYFGMDFLFHELPHEILPFDYDNFKKSTTKLTVAATDCQSGEIKYFSPQSGSNLDIIDKTFKASSSLPLVSSPVQIGDRLYLDGGIKDPIPVKKAFTDGFEKAVVILTREKDYQKEKVKGKFLLNLFLRNYPNLVDDILHRHQVYNNTLELIEAQEAAGKIFVFRPVNLEIDRFSKDVKQLERLYNSGLKIAENQAADLLNWLHN